MCRKVCQNWGRRRGLEADRSQEDSAPHSCPLRGLERSSIEESQVSMRTERCREHPQQGTLGIVLMGWGQKGLNRTHRDGGSG